MELLKEYCTALGGTLTALAIVKLLSETLLKSFFDKDLKRLEAKLDALNARDETKFNANYPKQVEVALKFSELSAAILHNAEVLFYVNSYYERKPSNVQAERIIDLQHDVDEKAREIGKAVSQNKYHIDADLIASINAFVKHLLQAVHELMHEDGANLAKILAELKSENNTIENKLRSIVGSDIK